MQNYKSGDFALNKFSEGIVYRFSDQIITVTLADYLTNNPDKTKQDFLKLKELSDRLFYEQDRADYNQTYKNCSMHSFEETLDSSCIPMDERLIEIQDRKYACKVIELIVNTDMLTAVQRRRCIKHFIAGLSLRKIAIREGVHFSSVAESINASIAKLKKLFVFSSPTHPPKNHVR